jgi:UrcA family protein
LKTPAPIALALALALLGPAAVQASTGNDVPTVRVSHADLDLAQPQGAATMLKRLDRASMSVCGASTFSLGQVKDAVRASDCYHQSLDRAVTSLAAPTVTAIYRDRVQRLASN